MIYLTITQNFQYLFRRGVQVQEKLRLDLRRKIEALDIDMTCFSLDNRLILLSFYLLVVFVVVYVVVVVVVAVIKQFNIVCLQLSRDRAAPRSSPGGSLLQRPTGKLAIFLSHQSFIQIFPRRRIFWNLTNIFAQAWIKFSDKNIEDSNSARQGYSIQWEFHIILP